MKKFFLILMVSLFIFLVPVSAFAVTEYKENYNDFGVADFPTPYESPSGYTNYVMVYTNNIWDLYYFDNDDFTVILDRGPVNGKYDALKINEGTKYDQFTTKVTKDTAVNKWYVPDWTLSDIDKEVNIAFYLGCSGVSTSRIIYSSFDLIDMNGLVYGEKNLFYRPPLAASLNLEQVTGVMVANSTMIIPVCLVILSILLAMALIKYILRSLLLRRN